MFSKCFVTIVVSNKFETEECEHLAHYAKKCLERGTDENEVVQAIQTGTRKNAKKGRFRYDLTFQYNSQWQDQFYALKRVSPIVLETEKELIVITVYTFYF